MRFLVIRIHPIFRYLLLALGCFFTSFWSKPSCSAQKYDYNWVLGYSNISTDPEYGGMTIDFTPKPPLLYKSERYLDIDWVNAVMSDSSGKLLFYSNGCEVSNSFDEQMENGGNLNPGQIFNDYCKVGQSYPSGTESMITVPIPGTYGNYIVFHQRIRVITQPTVHVLTDRLLTTTIDMSKNNGHGKVITKNKVVLQDSLSNGELSAIKHANGIDWWIICPGEFNNKYFSLLLTSAGIVDTVVSTIGDVSVPYGNGAGQAVFTPDGKRYIRYNNENQIRMFDFDRSNGVLSNYKHIEFDILGFNANRSGCAVSPNSRFLYVTTMKYIFQLDLQAADIGASVVLLAEWDGSGQPVLPATFYLCQLAADCKIYIVAPNGVKVMHVINQPNLKGKDCDLVQNGIKLPVYNFITIPNFPNYRQGPEGEPYEVCDSTVRVFPPIFEQPALSVFPNPANAEIKIQLTLPSSIINSARVELLNTLGQVVLSHKVEKTGEMSLFVGELPAGVYFLHLFSKSNRLIAAEKVVVSH